MFAKIKYLIVFLLFVSMASSAQNIKFEGKSDKKFDGNKVIIYNQSGLHDSAVIKDGKFDFNVPFNEPALFMFYSRLESKNKGGYSPFSILVTAPGAIKIKADAENFNESKVSGSKENDLYKNFAEKSGKARQKIINDLENKYGKEFVMSRNPDTSSAKYKELIAEYNTLNEASQKEQLIDLQQFIHSNPETFSSILFLNNYATTIDMAELESMYESLSPKYKDTKAGKSIVSTINARKITAIGKTAPDFTQADTSGNMVKLTDFRGKYVLVDFWASWCGPCRAENPNLVKTFNEYKDKGFTVLGVSLDQPGKKEAWLKAIHKDELTWTQVSDLKYWDNEVAVLYGIKAIPANLLLDPQGRIIAKDLRGEDLEKKLSEVIAKTQEKPFTIDGTIKENAGTHIYLSLPDGKTGKTKMDSSLIKNGQFQFAGVLSGPAQVYVTTVRQPRSINEYVQLYIEPGEMKLSLDGKNLSETAVLKGSGVQDEADKLNTLKAAVLAQMKPLSEAYSKANGIYAAAMREKKDEATREKLKDEAEKAKEAMYPYQKQLGEIETKFMNDNPASYVTASMLRYRISSMPLEEGDERYSKLSEIIKSSSLGQEIKKELDGLRMGSPGATASLFSSTELRGKMLSLSDYKGKYVLLDFWASWCVPCRKGNPHLLKLYSKYKDMGKGLEIIGVSDDDSKPEAWKKAVEKDGIGVWKHVLRGLKWVDGPAMFDRTNDISEGYGIHSLPTKILIDPNGIIIGRYDGGSEDDEAIDKKLAEIFGS